MLAHEWPAVEFGRCAVASTTGLAVLRAARASASLAVTVFTQLWTPMIWGTQRTLVAMGLVDPPHRNTPPLPADELSGNDVEGGMPLCW